MKEGSSGVFHAIPTRRKGILCDFKLFLQYKEENSLRLQAVPAIQRREFFETSRCSRTKEGNSLLLQRLLARQGWTLFDTSSCSRTKTWSLSDFKLFQEEKRTSLWRHALPARQGCILWVFKLFLQNKDAFSRILQGVPGRREDVSRTSTYSSTERLHSLMLQAVPPRKKRILWFFKRFEQYKEENSLWLQAVRGIKGCILWCFKLPMQ